jgi:hypothetical protein
MWRTLLAGVGAIAVLVAGSMVIIVLVTDDDRARPAARPPSSAAASTIEPSRPSGVPPPPQTLTFGEAPPVAAPQAPTTAPGAPAPPPPKGSWEAVPITARPRNLGRLGGLVLARLNDLHDELTACFTYEAQAQRGSGPVSTVRDAAPMDDSGGIVLVLQLEGQAGGFRIVDAPVETRGPAGDELLACAQSVLRGKVLEVPGAVPGSKYRLLHALTP